MKKLGLIFGLLLVLSACQQNKIPKDKEATPKTKKVVVEGNERQADHGQTKFVLFQSDYGPKETYQKLKAYLDEQGMYYPHVVDHETAAKNADVKIKPVYLVIFGNPKESAFLIKENPEVGIELPMKALIYKDNEGRTWVLYKDMNYLKELYFLKDDNNIIPKMNQLQEGFKQAVINPIKTTQITDEEVQ
jgi:uncharacterized protein (DUF302 family)